MDRDDYYPPGTPEREIAIRRRVHRLAAFYQHASVYVIVNGILLILNAFLVYGGGLSNKWSSWWVTWPALGWGIGLLVHGTSVLPIWNFFTQEWEDRKVKELMDREQR